MKGKESIKVDQSEVNQIGSFLLQLGVKNMSDNPAI